MRASSLALLLLLSIPGFPVAAVAAPPPAPPSAKPPAGAATPDFVGAWQGALQVGGTSLRLVARIHHGDKAGPAYTATLDSLDQGATGIPVGEVKVEGAHLMLLLPRLGASYDAHLEGDKLVGTWKQGAMTSPLELQRTADVAAAPVARPQNPRPPLPYDATEITVDNAAAGVQLACTFTHPRIPSPSSRTGAVVLITGSGPQDRDESLLGHKPFLVLADALTRRGVATLRCDDRGTGQSTGEFKTATTLDFTTDVLAAVAALRARPDVDAAHVGLVGHSEGGLIAPIAATKSKDVAFIVLLAGTGMVGEQILYAQGALIEKAAGQSDTDVAQSRAFKQKLLTIVKTEKDDAVATQKIKAAWDTLPADVRARSEGGEAARIAQTQAMLTPWFRTFLTLDPVPYLKRVSVPVLAVGGERDLQVPPRENLALIAAALAGKRDVTVKELPGLNHLFQTCTSGSPSEYARIEETFAPSALALVGDWVARHAHP